MGARRIALVAFASLLFAHLTSAEARADIDRQIRQLRDSDNFKVRLSAALSLAKTRDRRAVAALASALYGDSSATIRRVAVDSLGKILARPLPAKTVRIGLSALETAAQRDSDDRVRRAASRLHAKITRRRRNSGGEFVALGQASDPNKVGTNGIKRDMISTVSKAVERGAPSYDVFPRAESPNNARGWYIGASIAELSVKRVGRQTEVRCRVSLRVSPYLNGQERFIAGETASAKGSARVVGGSSRRELDRSKRECVIAVTEQVTERQVLPFIKQAAGKRVATGN